MKHTAVRQLVGTVLAALALAGLLLGSWRLLQGKAAPKPPEEDHPVAPVKAVAAQRVPFGEWTPVVGTTQPLPGKVGHVSAAFGGQVVSMLEDREGNTLAEGGSVKARQV